MRSRRSRGTYYVHVAAEGRSTWATFLTQQTSRPGWSVARLARESGIHRSTIFRWIKGGGGVTMRSVHAVADALHVPLATALAAAGNLVPEPGNELAQYRDEHDEIIDMVLGDEHLDPATKMDVIKLLIERREHARQQLIIDAQWLIRHRRGNGTDG